MSTINFLFFIFNSLEPFLGSSQVCYIIDSLLQKHEENYTFPFFWVFGWGVLWVFLFDFFMCMHIVISEAFSLLDEGS